MPQKHFAGELCIICMDSIRLLFYMENVSWWWRTCFSTKLTGLMRRTELWKIHLHLIWGFILAVPTYKFDILPAI